MRTLHEDLVALERHIQMMNKAAGQVSPQKMAEGANILLRMAQQVGDMSGNSAYASVSESEVFEAGDPEPEVETAEDVKLAFDTYQANSRTATSILDKMEAANQQIDQLVKAGKRFDATRAREDLHEVTSKVASIVAQVDLATTPWVKDDLKKLASRADYLHGLFFPKG